MQPTLALVGPTSPTPTQRMDADDLVGLGEEEDKQWANKPQRRVLICWDAANGTSAVTQRIADLQHLTRDAAQPAVGRHLGTVPGGIVRRNRSRVLLTVKPSGRLGNLMFQWAALLGLAKKSGLRSVVYTDLPNHHLCPAQGSFDEFALRRFVRDNELRNQPVLQADASQGGQAEQLR